MTHHKSPYPTATPFLPSVRTLPVLKESASGCQGCDLYKNATQTVFGEGPAGAIVMFVGEQPGDLEDRSGRPFVGPAGQLLDDAIIQAGLNRSDIYLTNAVKHFKWERRGNRRLHVKPSVAQVNACKPWLIAEIEATQPRMIVCLGATAAQSLLGAQFRLTRHRGQILSSPWAPSLLATVHPAALLRIPDEQARRAAYLQFVDDLRLVARQLHSARQEQPLLFPPRTRSTHPGHDAGAPGVKRPAPPSISRRRSGPRSPP